MNELLATWVPAPILAAVVIFFGRSLWKRLERIETAIEQLHKFATVEQLGSMGNRFDERVANLRERVSVIESRLERIERMIETLLKERRDVHNE